MSDSEVRLEFVGRLGEEFVERFRRGERPALSEYTDKYPEHADDIRELFPALVMMEDLAPQDRESLGLNKPSRPDAPPEKGLERLGDFHVIREVGRGGMGIVYEAEQLSLGRRVALKVLPQQLLLDAKHKRRFEREAKAAARLHHTNIVPVFGVGEENGLHYYVMQFIQGLGLDEVIHELQRLQSNAPTGATKPPTGELRVSKRHDVAAADVARSLMSGQFEQTIVRTDDPERARADAVTVTHAEPPSSADSSTSAAGRLSDTFAVSSSSTLSLPVGGGSEINRGRHPQTYWHSVAHIGRQVAEALHYAHEQGVLHRDIKPSNLLLDLRGTVWVTDFGLAKAGDQQDITHTGDVLGTLRYMPPEAFNGLTDARSDVYSLGLTLYELLALRPAFQEKDRHRLIKLVTTGEPEHLDKLNPEVPRDLSTIVHKAIDHDPAQRYSSAADLAHDLQQFLDDEPIQARRITSSERLVRWTKHNKGLAAALTTLAAVLILVAAGSAISAARFQTLADERQRLLTNANELAGQRQAALEAEQRSAQDAQSAKDQVEQVLVDMSVERGVLAAERGQDAEAVLWFARAAQLAPDGSPRQQDNLVRAAQYLNGVTRPVRMFEHPAEWVEDLSFDPSGRYLRSFNFARGATKPAACRLWDVERGAPLDLPEFSGDLTAAAWSSDGRLAALGTSAGSVLLWDLQDRQVVPVIKEPSGIDDLTFSGNSHMLGVAAGPMARVWDIQAQTEATAPQPHPEPILSIALSHDGARIATVCRDNQLRVFACPSDTGQTLLPAVACRGALNQLTWEPLIHSGPRFDDDGRGILFVALDGLRYLDLERRECLARESRVILGYAMHPGEPRSIVTYGWKGNELETFRDGDESTRSLISHRGNQPLFSAAFTVDGSELLTAGGDRLLNSWNVADVTPGRLSLEHSSSLCAVGVSPDGRRIATAQQGGLIIIWELPQSGRKPPGHFALQTSLNGGTLVCCSRDGRFFAPTGRTNRDAQGGTTQVFDAQARQPLGQRLTVKGTLLDAKFTHDGNRLVTLSSDGPASRRYSQPGRQSGWLQVLDWRSGEVSAEVALNAEPRSIDISPDGAVLAVLSVDGVVRIFDSETARELRQWQAVEPFAFNNWYIYNGALRFAPQGRRLVTWNTDPVIRVWDADTGAMEYGIEHGGLTDSVAFSADGQLLATSCRGESGKSAVRVIEFETGRIVGGPFPHPDWAFGVAFSPDGRLLVSACRDSTARIWDWRAGTLHLPPLEHDHEIHAVSFSPDGRFIVTAGDDERVRIWSALDGKPVMPPQPLSGMGWTIAWAGTTAVVAGKGPVLAVFDLANLSRWTDRSVADVVRLSELAAGRRVEAGGETPLTAAEWLDRYRSSRTAIPDAFALRFGPAESARVVADKHATTSIRDELARHWRNVPMPRAGTGRESVTQAAEWGEQRAREGDWPMAARYFLFDVHGNPGNALSALKLAQLLVDNGVLDVYRILCELELKQFASTDDPLTAYRIARLCLLTPDAGVDRDAVRRLADLAVAQGKGHALEPVFLMTRGLLALRDGEFDAAIEWSQRARESVDESRHEVQLPCVIVAALAKRQAGRESEAEEELARAQSLVREHLSLDPNQPAIALYPNALLCRALLRETGVEPAEPADAAALLNRAKVHLLLGRYPSAADNFRRSLELNPDDQLPACYRIFTLVQQGDRDGIADARRALLERWGTTEDPVTAERTAKAYLLSPDSGPDMARACELADLAVERGVGHQYERFFWHAKALAEYRRERFAESLDWSQKVNQVESAGSSPLSIASALLTAMALHRMGKLEEARQTLDSVRSHSRVRGVQDRLLGTAIWHADDLWWMALKSEATALIDGPSPATEQPGTAATESRTPE